MTYNTLDLYIVHLKKKYIYKPSINIQVSTFCIHCNILVKLQLIQRNKWVFFSENENAKIIIFIINIHNQFQYEKSVWIISMKLGHRTKK